MKKKAPVKKAPPKKVVAKKPPKPPCKKMPCKKTPKQGYGHVRASYPQRLFGLIQADNKGQKIVAQVLTPTKSEAISLFQKDSKWSLLLSDRIQKSSALQVVELGGLDLPYVQEMKPGVVRHG